MLTRCAERIEQEAAEGMKGSEFKVQSSKFGAESKQVRASLPRLLRFADALSPSLRPRIPERFSSM